MKRLLSLQCDPSKAQECCQKITRAFQKNCWVELLPPKGKKIRISHGLLPEGPGVIISSGGSTDGPHQCLQPLTHLNQSAFATAKWLSKQDIQVKDCLIFNPLPIHHVSGLMAWWRSCCWKTKHQWIHPSLMRDPYELENSYKSILTQNTNPTITSLVPTQLKRLLAHPSGIRWLQSFEVIWLGGAAITTDLADSARKKGIRLAPCYGTTETMAMVTALYPKDFLQGKTFCGSPLNDVELRIGEDKALEIRTKRIAQAIWNNRQLTTIVNQDGWWRSGDSAEIINEGNLKQLKIIGRLDTAINSGGETIFPEKLQQRLIEEAQKTQIPIDSILITSIADEEWGKRLVALIRLKSSCTTQENIKVFRELKGLVKDWLPAERPIKWYECQTLKVNSNGKWDLNKWNTWIKNKRAIS